MNENGESSASEEEELIVQQRRKDKKHKWEGNITEVFKKFIDLDINKAHQSEIEKLHQMKAEIDEFNKSVTRKSMIRYLTIIVDFSKASMKQDLRPNRAMVTKENLH